MYQPLAYIHQSAKVARNVVVEPFVTIDKNVEIGEGTWIGSNVTIMEGAKIGKNCKIFPGAVISAIPQDLKFRGENSFVIIGDDVTIREGVTVNRGTKASGRTVVGNNCLLMANAHVAHDCILEDNVILVNNVILAGHVEVGSYAILGGLSAIHQFVRIGQHSILSGGALVGKDVPPYTKAGRYPLCFLGINSVGMRRRNFDTRTITQIQKVYRILFQSNNNTSQAVNVIEGEVEATKERDEILEFLKTSKRGIMKGFNMSKYYR